MTTPASQPRRATARDLLYFTSPKLWPTWPFLAVVRYLPDGDMDCGVLFDALGTSGTTGYSATVLLTNIFTLPPTVDELLALPKETYDTADELGAVGWVID